MRRALRAVGAAVLIGALLVGVPVLLAVVAGWPLPTRMPDWNGIYWQARQGDVPAEFIIKTFACAVWLAWTQIAWALLWELVVNVPRTLRGDPERNSPATAAPASRLAGRLVTAVMLLSALSSTPATTVAAPSLASLVSRGGDGGLAPAPVTQPLDHYETASPARSFFDQAAWVAASGDTLWDVAEQCLGDGSRVDDILKCNPHLDPARPLDAGARVVLPAGTTAPASRNSPTRDEIPAPAGQPSAPTATVVTGDTLWALTMAHYGHVDTDLVQAVAQASAIDNPSLIRPGDTIVFPTAPAPAPAVETTTVMPRPTPNVHVVVDGDTLWGIVEQHYGAVETDLLSAVAAANAIDDPSLIFPGQTVQLPPVAELDAGATAPLEPPGLPQAVDELAVAHDIPLAPPAAADLGTPLFDMSDPLPPAPADPVPAERVPENTVPTTSRDASVQPATPTTTSPAVASPSDASGDAADRPAPSTPSPIRFEHAALLSAGIVTLLAVRRRQRLRGARPRHRVPPPRPEVIQTERRLRGLDAGERALRVDVAGRAAAWSLLGTQAQIGWIEVSNDGDIDLQLTAPAELPAPWTGAGAAWRMSAEVPIDLLSDRARQVDMPCVAFVQIGVTASGGDLLTDLEACGTLAVEADAGQADAAIAAIAAGLASSPQAEVAHLIGVSLPEVALLGHRNAHFVESVDAAFDLASSLVGTTVANDDSTFALRSRRTGGEIWEPAIVILTSADEAHSGVSSRLAFEPGHGVGVVVAVAPGTRDRAPARIVAEADGWRFAAFDTSVEFTPVGLTPADLSAIDDVLANEVLEDAACELDSLDLVAAGEMRWQEGGTVAQPAGSLPAPHDEAGLTFGDGEPAFDDHDVDRRDVPHLAPFVPMAHEIVVRLLGPIEIVDRNGTPGAFERSKTVELVAWLATHRQRATRIAARTALWEIDVRDATFANVVSEARRGLARLVAPPGSEEWVARTLSEQLPLHEAVVTDAQLMEERVAHARNQPPVRAMEVLRPAVASIGGMPFAGTNYLWPDAEGITSDLVLLAITAAAEYADHALSLGETDEVFWATGQGLKVLAGHEELIGLRMRAHARAGDLAGVRQEWESYERVLVADAWSDGEPAPKLVALRHELLSSS